MAHYLDKDGLLRFFQGLKNVFAAKNHSHTTVNGHTVNADVPSGAKFTDTVYTHPSYTSKSSGLYKVTVDSTGHVSGTAAVAKSDITALGIPEQDTTYSAASQSAAGLMSAADKKKLDGIAAGAQVNTVTGVKGNSESSYRTGNVNLTAANIGAAASSHTHVTTDLTRPAYLRGSLESTLDSKIASTRANRLAFLPADQIIAEQTVDGGTTWTDAGVTDYQKKAVFSDVGGSIPVPKINGRRNAKCGIRFTITGMKYSVPDGTAETQKYNYWNASYATATDRYCIIKELFLHLNTVNDTLSLKIEVAKGSTSTTWSTVFNNSAAWLTGWSGIDYVRFNPTYFGGGTGQTDRFWNWRLTFMTKGPEGADEASSVTTWDSQTQLVMKICGYGDDVWTASNTFMSKDHLYSFDVDQNATFPAKVTASSFAGNGASITALNGSNISSGTVPAARLPAASTTAQGAMSADDKVKLNGIAAGAQVNSITGVKGNAESSYRTGNVNLTAANIGAAAATHSHAASDISSGTLDAARIPSLDASKIGSGTLAAARLPLASGSANGAMSKSDKVKLDAFADPEFYVKTINGVAPDVNGNVVVSSDQDGHMFQFRGQYFQLNIPQTGWTQATGGSYYVEIPLSGVNVDNVIHPTWYNAEVLTDTVELYIYSSTVMRVTTTTVPDGNLLVEGEISNYPESATAHPARAAQLYPHRVKASCPIEIGWSGDNTFIMLEAADGSQKQYVINDTKGIVASKRDSASDNWEVIPQDVSYGGTGMTGAAAISITAASGVTINSNESFRFGKIGVLSFRATFTATGKTSVGTIAAGSRPGKNFYGNMMNDTLGNVAVRAFAIGSAGNIACENNYTANKQYRFNLVYQIA